MLWDEGRENFGTVNSELWFMNDCLNSQKFYSSTEIQIRFKMHRREILMKQSLMKHAFYILDKLSVHDWENMQQKYPVWGWTGGEIWGECKMNIQLVCMNCDCEC